MNEYIIHNNNNLQKNIDIVIFIITFNRKNMLERILKSYNNLESNFNIIIIDNGTNDKECIKYLYSLDYTILQFNELYKTNLKNSYEQLISNIQTSIDFYYNHNFSKYYAVSDVDISFEKTSKDVLNIYREMIDLLNCNVGPELDILDIPDYYPLKMKIILDTKHIFLPEYPTNKITINNKEIKYHRSNIDTTFTMFLYKTNMNYKPCNNNIRVLYPYTALHLDWYFNAVDLDSDSLIYMNTAEGLGGYASGYIKNFVNNILNNKVNIDNFLVTFNYEEKNILSYHIDWYFAYWLLSSGFYNIPKDIEKANKLVLNYIDYQINIEKKDWYDGVNRIKLVKKYF